MRQLWEMKRRYGDRLRVRCFVDEEGSFITEKDVRAALQGPERLASGNGEGVAAGAGCPYHSAKLLEGLSADPAPRAAESDSDRCGCGSRGADLVVVSGPDGFVTALAGSKKWEGGEERQGPVGGVLGRIRSRYPSLLREWLVLKL